MEQLLAAARRGDIRELRNLINDGDNERIHREMALQKDNYTPLHVACATGQLKVVQELRRWIPLFLKEIDAGGLSPLHIAAARGHVEIVKELLLTGKSQCSVKAVEDRIPLHYAIVNGELDVMKLLLPACPGSVKLTTSRHETVLHLAVRNNWPDAVVWLVENLKQDEKELINWKDNDGNTALHLAAAAQNFKVVDFMLGQHALRHVFVDVNASNKAGWTPLDCLQRGAGYREIRKILSQAGAIHGSGRASSLVSEAESKGDMRNALLVVATLIANATFQSVLQPPHFLKEVDKKTYTKGFLAWYVSLMTSFFGKDLAYIVFISGNTFGLLVSVQMIICLTKDLSIKLPMLLSMTLMVQTYYCHTYYLPFKTLEEKKFSLINVELLSVLPLTIPFFLLLIQKPLAKALEFFFNELSLFDHLSDIYRIST